LQLFPTLNDDGLLANNELFLEWQCDAEEYEIPQNDPAFDYLIGTAPGAIGQEGLFPMGEISLIAGPSGAGKTTFAVQFFQSWREGKTFLGRPVHPRQYQFITYDRRINSFRRTLHRMGLKEGNFEWKPLTPSYSQPLIDVIQQMWKADKKAEDVRVFLVEGLDLAAETEPRLPTATQVRNYLSALQDFCEKNHIAVIGTVGSPKAKPGDKYLSPRERISGTAWWGRMTETILVIEPAQEEDQNSIRNLFVLPRNGKNEQHQFKFENGRLQQVSGLAYRIAREHIVGYLNRPEVKPHFKKADLVRELGLVSTTVSNAVDKLVKEGKKKLFVSSTTGCMSGSGCDRTLTLWYIPNFAIDTTRVSLFTTRVPCLLVGIYQL
jgi:AAA domain-containing protein